MYKLASYNCELESHWSSNSSHNIFTDFQKDNNPGFSSATGHFTQVSPQCFGFEMMFIHRKFLGSLEEHNAGCLRHSKLPCWYYIPKWRLQFHCLSVYASWKRPRPISVSTPRIPLQTPLHLIIYPQTKCWQTRLEYWYNGVTVIGWLPQRLRNKCIVL